MTTGTLKGTQPDWNLVADNYQACLHAVAAGYDFSLCINHPGVYSTLWDNMADSHTISDDYSAHDDYD